MSVRLRFHRNGGIRSITVAGLRTRLADESGLVCMTQRDEAETRVVLGENDVVLSLQFDVDGEPSAALAEFSYCTEVRNVVSVCKTFRAMGWEVGDAPP